MRERADDIGAVLRVRSRINLGTTVEVHWSAGVAAETQALPAR